MGRMKWDEYQKMVTLDAILYRLKVFYPKKGLTQQDKYSILSTLYRCKRKYPHVSFLYVESTTGDIKGRKTFYTGKPGRPKTKPVGKEVPEHVHIVAIGTKDKSANTYAVKVKKAINKRFLSKRPM